MPPSGFSPVFRLAGTSLLLESSSHHHLVRGRDGSPPRAAQLNTCGSNDLGSLPVVFLPGSPLSFKLHPQLTTNSRSPCFCLCHLGSLSTCYYIQAFFKAGSYFVGLAGLELRDFEFFTPSAEVKGVYRHTWLIPRLLFSEMESQGVLNSLWSDFLNHTFWQC